jgi:hypothetical protein
LEDKFLVVVDNCLVVEVDNYQVVEVDKFLVEMDKLL